MENNRTVSFKNYVILSIVLIFSIVVIIYFYMWYGEFHSNRILTPVMNQYLSVINYNVLDTYLVENKDSVIYISNLNDSDTRNFERKFKEIVREYSLGNDILYLDLTNEYKDDKLYKEIEEKYKLPNLPCIVIFKDGKINDFYSIEDRNYNMDLLVSYLEIKGVIYD